jgi:hypothetical protein
MSALWMTVGIVSPAAAVICGMGLLRQLRGNKNERQKQAQIKRRLEASDRKRKIAVSKLEYELTAALAKCSIKNYGQSALIEAQKLAEEIFFKWLAENYGLFHCAFAESRIHVEYDNKRYYYWLPDQLQPYQINRNKHIKG